MPAESVDYFSSVICNLRNLRKQTGMKENFDWSVMDKPMP